jgi:hypothetical protein
VSSVEADSALQLVLQFDGDDSPSDVVDALLLSAFVSGGQPWARTALEGGAEVTVTAVSETLTAPRSAAAQPLDRHRHLGADPAQLRRRAGTRS